jgi:hypothetical protein
MGSIGIRELNWGFEKGVWQAGGRRRKRVLTLEREER